MNDSAQATPPPFERAIAFEFLVEQGYLQKTNLSKFPFVDPKTSLYELTQKAFMLAKKPNAA